jgi:hypothetical protein
MVEVTLEKSPRRHSSGATDAVSDPGASNLVP